MSRARGPHIRVTIDEVVLRGVPPERAREVLSDIEAALEVRARDAAAGGDLGGDVTSWGGGRSESSRRMPDLRSDGVSVLGIELADAVWRELAPPALGPRSDSPARPKGLATTKEREQ